MDVTEKRKSIRLPVDLPAILSYQSRDFSGRILNLSVDGALLWSGQLVNTGESIDIRFVLQNHEVRSKAQIRWRRSVNENTFGMGLLFEDMPALHQAAIDLFIRNLLKI